MIKNILWDLDGTLFDTYPSMTTAFADALKKEGVIIHYDEIFNLLKFNFNHCLTAVQHRYKLDVDNLLKNYLHNYKQISLDDQPPFKNVIDVCKLIVKNGGKNVIVTHKDRAASETLLSEFNIKYLFFDSITKDEKFPLKPNPAAFREIIQRNNLNINETLAVGDRELDIVPGLKLDMKTCLFIDNKNNNLSEIKLSMPGKSFIYTNKIPADLKIYNFKQLCDIIEDGV